MSSGMDVTIDGFSTAGTALEGAQRYAVQAQEHLAGLAGEAGRCHEVPELPLGRVADAWQEPLTVLADVLLELTDRVAESAAVYQSVDADLAYRFGEVPGV